MSRQKNIIVFSLLWWGHSGERWFWIDTLPSDAAHPLSWRQNHGTFLHSRCFFGQLRKKNSLLKKTEDNAVCGSFSYSLICTFVSSVKVVLLIITIIIIVINIIITIIIITVRHCRVSIWPLWASACIKPTTTTTTTTQVGGCCCHRDHIWYRLCSALCPGTAARLYLYSKNKKKSKHLTVFMPLFIWLIGIHWLCDFLWLRYSIYQVCSTEARCSSF